MKAQADADADADPGTPAGTPPGDGASSDGRVAPMGDDDFSDLNDNTERSEVDIDALPPHAGAQPASPPAAAAEPTPAPAPDEKATRERRATLVSTIPAQLARSMMSDSRPTV